MDLGIANSFTSAPKIDEKAQSELSGDQDYDQKKLL
jgi:hypothetical protein